MKIVHIFANQLFSFHFGGKKMNELRGLLKLWNDTSYLYKFVTENESDVPKKESKLSIVNQLIENANEIDDILIEISNDPKRSLEEFFKPLHNQEFRIVKLSRQKGRKNYLRLFAIKIDTNCFVITGGAIKFHHLNKDRLHTLKEMQKIESCRGYLKDNNVFDFDSFQDFLKEQQ